MLPLRVRRKKSIVRIIAGLLIAMSVIGCATQAASVQPAANDEATPASETEVSNGSQPAEPDTPKTAANTGSEPETETTGTGEELPGPGEAASDAGQAPESSRPNPNAARLKQETRAVWSWAGRRPVSGRREISRQDVDELVATVDAANLNAIFLLVYHYGTAFFEPSRTRFPDEETRLSNQSDFLKNDSEYSDALSYLLAIRDERRADDDPANDFEVHAWFTVIIGGHRGDGWPPEDRTRPYMLNSMFPEFKLKYGAYHQENDERYVDHAISNIRHPEFRDYIVNLIAGLAEDYDVDGIHLDDIRTGGICFDDEPVELEGNQADYAGCQADYEAWTRENYGQEYSLRDDTNGHKKILDGESGRVASWQEQIVNQLVERIHNEVKAVDSELIISAAAANWITPESRFESTQGQVAWEWLDKGWVDAIFIMTYTPDTGQVIETIEQIRSAAEKESSRSRVFAGLLTFSLSDRDDLWSDLVAEQVKAVMREEWSGQPLEPPVKGVAFFLERRISDEAIEALTNTAFEEPASPFWGK